MILLCGGGLPAGIWADPRSAYVLIADAEDALHRSQAACAALKEHVNSHLRCRAAKPGMPWQTVSAGSRRNSGDSVFLADPLRVKGLNTLGCGAFTRFTVDFRLAA